MGNLITNEKNGEYLQLSNGGTSVLLSVLLLSGSDVAETPWEIDFVCWLAEHDSSLRGPDMSSFDINDIAWDRAQFVEQKRFVLKVIHKAMKRHRWDALPYDPPYVLDSLTRLRDMLMNYQSDHIGTPAPQWNFEFKAEPAKRCAVHQVYEHSRGCFICLDN